MHVDYCTAVVSQRPQVEGYRVGSPVRNNRQADSCMLDAHQVVQ